MKICEECERYVKVDENTCPFCQGSHFAVESHVGVGQHDWSRSKIYAARVVIASAAVGAAVACASDQDLHNEDTASGGDHSFSTGGQSVSSSGGSTNELGGFGGIDSGGEGNDVAVPIYGGPFPDMTTARV